MLYNCPSLEYLDISNFNPITLSQDDSIFDNLNNIKYINLNHLTNENLVSQISNLNLKDKNNLIVCQNNLIIKNQNAINDCFDFSDNTIKSDSDNYITIKYNDNTEYQSGFKIDNCPSRKKISYIIYHDIISMDEESLIIDANQTIEIHFTNIITSLENFFNCEQDTNAKNIISVDFSHFDSSLIKNIDNMFYKCSSLNSLDISNFDLGSIEISDNTNSLLTNLVDIKFINLSN